MHKATFRVGSNIAFIKYWGVQKLPNTPENADLHFPLSNSISMTLADAYTVTTVEWDSDGALQEDVITLDGIRQPSASESKGTARLVRHLDRIRALAGQSWRANVTSQNNFPMAAGIASSASGFAALTVAGCHAAGLALNNKELSALARMGSGSASRSLFGGFVEWEKGHDHGSSVAHMLYPADHWALCDVVAVASAAPKRISSAEGHKLAMDSPLNHARLAYVEDALAETRQAIANRDLAQLGPVIEQDALAMHAVMMTSTPSLFYWQPATIEIIQAVYDWREEGLPVYFTIDAGPNIHLICEQKDVAAVEERTHALTGVQQTIVSRPGLGPQKVEESKG
ncbi:MAG: diphosphomevalonate decarboxylase [Chloroflexota bacterium]